jgi:hypothetical protein
MEISELEKRLDDFDGKTRLLALKELKKRSRKGEIAREKSTFVNLHYHTFFSFNACGYSPSHVAWLAYIKGLEVIGIVDFDCLDGVGEILEAGNLLGIKTTAGLETRVIIDEYKDKVINSPGEPGVYYYMGTGFYKPPVSGSKSEMLLNKLIDTSKDRNLYRLSSINEMLKDIKIDYEKDILPLTPKKNATERHMLTAIDSIVRKHFGGDTAKVSAFWIEKAGLDKGKTEQLVNNPPEFQMLLRSKIMKKSPDESKKFPSFEEATEMILDMDAIPTGTWLDGTNDGEKDIKPFLKRLIEKGISALNIVPDRNWNVKDPKEKEIKYNNLKEVIKTANELDLPLIAGTEMNKAGLKFVDDFGSSELAPFLNDFRKGAFFVYGHTQAARLFNMGSNSVWSKRHFKSRILKNIFYTEAGKIIRPDKEYKGALIDDKTAPDEFLSEIRKKS